MLITSKERKDAVGLIHSLFGRRQFLIAFVSSILVPSFRRFARAFDLIRKDDVAKASEESETGEKKYIKGIVVYYSATGSTAKVAKAIHRGMNAIMECDIATVKEADPKEMGKYDVIGIGSPIWFYRETANVHNFTYNMPRMDGKFCFPFCTHGETPDGYFYSITRNLLKRGLTVIGWNDWYGSVFHVLHMPKPDLTDGHPDKIDLMEAEAFGREMAERTMRIIAGERDLIPEIPIGPDADSLWIAHFGLSTGGEGMPGADVSAGDSLMVAGGQRQAMPISGTITADTGSATVGMPISRDYLEAGGESGASVGPEGGGVPGGMSGSEPEIPKIDTTKCIYPRCTACMDNCPVGAIDISITSPAAWVSESVIFIKGCLHCQFPLCQRACSYDAIIYTGGGTEHVINMTKCTYPKCTLCVEHCPMNSIDFSENPPVIHNTCESCDVCWCICPEGAVEIPNLEFHRAMKKPRTGGFVQRLAKAEAAGRFRRLVPLDQIGWDNYTCDNTNLPRMAFTEDDEWPIMKDKAGNVIRNYYD